MRCFHCIDDLCVSFMLSLLVKVDKDSKGAYDYPRTKFGNDLTKCCYIYVAQKNNFELLMYVVVVRVHYSINNHRINNSW